MDARDDEGDIKLQKQSADLIADLDRTLPTFLRKPDGHGGNRLRSRVRVVERHRLDSAVLGPFQELPQLLDPHLSRFIPLLSQAYLESLGSRAYRNLTATKSVLIEPLPRAVARLLYTFCKIRGEKVVVRFLGAETRYLEPLVSAIENAEKASQDGDSAFALQWTWEERYVTLLWISHLLFAPFDLSSISSIDLAEVSVPTVPGLKWPENLPGITLRILPLAMRYLASPGKERDGAKALLVRMSMRKDMQQLGVLDALINWSLWALRLTNEPLKESPYYYIGILSYLAGVLTSSMDTSDMDKYLVPIFNATNAITDGGTPVYDAINGSALARKMIIKVMRSATVLILRQEPQTFEGAELVEACIGSLLEKLSDNDTPVRFSASKALSVITLRLDPDMASQVVEAVLESLNRKVLWVKDPEDANAKLTRDISSVDPLEWHGLMLTLSHLLYRRSPPPDQLSDIIHALLLGLSFEQRSTSGGSIGSNVRDAACFGIWALSRRYTTQELLGIPVDSVFAAKSHPPGSSIIQVLATELVVTASRDPAGNIRRGSSAALQELVGRHPDTVEKGIWVVQTVDYHAVALRSRAINDVALRATDLSSRYGEALLEALLGWRGVGDADAAARRSTGESFGAITLELASLDPSLALERFNHSVDMIVNQIKKLQARQAEERHGLLLSLASVLDRTPDVVRLLAKSTGVRPDKLKASLRRIIGNVVEVLEELKGMKYRRQELVAEAGSQLVISLTPILQASVLSRDGWDDDSTAKLRTGRSAVATLNTGELTDLMAGFVAADLADYEAAGLVSILGEILPTWLEVVEEDALDAAAEAALVFLMFSKPDDRAVTIRRWSDLVRVRTPQLRTPNGYFHALSMAYPVSAEATGPDSQEGGVICEALLQRWASEKDIETKSFLLRSLRQGDILRKQTLLFLDMLEEGLNDYTATSRGDIGSYLRFGALRATGTIWRDLATASASDYDRLQKSVERLFLSVLRLAGEKLDRVRNEAQNTLSLVLTSAYTERFRAFTPSSRMYLNFLIRILETDCLLPVVSASAKANKPAWTAELLAGYVTSADTGNENLVITSRAVLCAFCEESQEHLDLVCGGLVRNLRERQGQDRVLVPTLEIVSYLLNVGILQRSGEIDARSLCLLTQKSCYKSSNVRKVEACIKVYGGIARLAEQETGEVRLKRVGEGVEEAKTRLGALMFHPWPRARSWVVDELWSITGGQGGEAGARLKGVDWGAADKGAVSGLVKDLGIGVS
ncbi:related to tubulin-folding cofactor D (chaperone) [Cephalotrichum gorgonifer]|uniref:Related to tubulin-folding cofactor D (Chaperone) n=1 Tax=Cephalotrichum gorgonifer TaxID=2041049 RepID=A0AAE8N5H2_9PEZI|nr:related to tubulin-folding cofactor D (chaperone) [Cephalotrichum gorgonifer]